MVEQLLNRVANILQDVFVTVSDLVPHFGATNLVIAIALLIPILVLLGVRIWSSLDRFRMQRRLSSDFGSMAKFIAAKHAQISGIEAYVARYLPQLSADGMRSLELSKRLSAAMRNVLLEIDALLRGGTEHDLIRAQALRDTPLEVPNSPLETVQLDVELPALEWDEWQQQLSAVLEVVSAEIEASKKHRGELLSEDSTAGQNSQGAHAPRVVNIKHSSAA